MDKFSKYNPKATLLYFVCIITATLILFNPIYLSISLISSLCYKLMSDGLIKTINTLKFALPFIILIALFNMLFVSKGATVLFTAFDRSFTLEALFYGICQGVLFNSVIIWFSCYNTVVSAEGFMAVFGRISPNISLVFSMTLTFIPRLRKNLNEIIDARSLVDTKQSKLKSAIENLSALITMTLEESIETAESMKARGFNNKRTVYSKYRFSFSDGVLIAVEIILLLSVIIVKALGKALFIYEPIITMPNVSIIGVISFAVLAFIPSILDALENIRWHLLRQKI
ncbi:MAG: hypothetical protein J1E81_07105 [Eubacterium sp.]|nr:hypothetical protein [Eubacterium sp.]